MVCVSWMDVVTRAACGQTFIFCNITNMTVANEADCTPAPTVEPTPGPTPFPILPFNFAGKVDVWEKQVCERCLDIFWFGFTSAQCETDHLPE